MVISREVIPSTSSNNYKYFAIFTPTIDGKEDTTKRTGHCLICNKNYLCGTNKGNLIMHLKNEHVEFVPFEDLDVNSVKSWSELWLKVESHNPREVKNMKHDLRKLLTQLKGLSPKSVPLALESDTLPQGKITSKLSIGITDKDLRQILVKGIIRGHFPLAYIDNPGFKLILRNLVGRDIVGSSARTVGRDLDVLYQSMLEEKKKVLTDIGTCFPNGCAFLNIQVFFFIIILFIYYYYYYYIIYTINNIKTARWVVNKKIRIFRCGDKFYK
jgi:hypothetical protein